MGNITAAADGSASVEYVDPRASFEGPNSILGRGVIVHANAGRHEDAADGQRGRPVACGVVGAVKGQ